MMIPPDDSIINDEKPPDDQTKDDQNHDGTQEQSENMLLTSQTSDLDRETPSKKTHEENKNDLIMQEGGECSTPK